MYSPEECIALRECFTRLGFTPKHPLMVALDKQEDVKLNTPDQYGYTPLRIAIQRQDLEAIELLYTLEAQHEYLSEYDFAYLSSVITSTKKPFEKLPLPTHFDLIFCFQSLYELDSNYTYGGMCFGLAQMRRRAFLCGEQDVYLNRLKNMRSNLWPLVKKNLTEVLTELKIEEPIPEDKRSIVFKKVREKLHSKLPHALWYDWYAFFDGVILYCHPEKFSELFEPGTSLTQTSLAAESLVASITMEEQGFFSKPSYIFSGCYTSEQLLDYFRCLEEAIFSVNKPVSFTIHTGAHAFNIDYYQGTWFYTDPNHLEDSEQECNSSKLVQLLSKHYPSPLIFTTKMYLTPDAEEDMDKAIAYMKKRSTWKRLHQRISKEQVMAKNSSGFSLLYIATSHGDLDMVKRCLRAGALCQGEGEKQFSPLYTAVSNGHLPVVQELLKVPERKKITCQRTTLNSTVLHIAAEKGHLDILRELIQYPEVKKLIYQKNNFGESPIYLAAKHGHADVVKALSQLVPDEELKNQPGKHNTGLLHVAADCGHLEVVQELLQARSEDTIIQGIDDSGRTALHYAACKGHLEIVQELLQASSEDQRDQLINQPDREGLTPLFAALKYNNWGVFNALFHAIKDKQTWFQKNSQGSNLLHGAAARGWLEIVQELIAFCNEEGWVNQSKPPFGNTPIHVASEKGYVDVIQELFKVVKGESARNQMDKEGSTPFYLAAQNGHLKVVQEFIKEVPDNTIRNKPTPEKITPLSIASFKGHLEIVEEILNAGIDEVSEYAHFNASNALFFAAQEGHLEIVRALLKALQNKKLANQGNKEGMTPLAIAAKNGHLEIVQEILDVLDEEETINKPNKEGQTPIYFAAGKGHFEIVQELLEKVKDEKVIHQTSKKGGGPLHMAAQAGHSNIVQELLEATQSQEIVDQAIPEGSTSVFLAVQNGFLETAEVLLRSGANPDKSVTFELSALINEAKRLYVEKEFSELIQNEGLSGKIEGFSPLHMAVLLGRSDIVSLLLELGADWETQAGGLSVFKLASALGRLDLFPEGMLQEHKELEQMLEPLRSSLKEYIDERNSNYLFKDLLSSRDKVEREQFIKAISGECQYLHSGETGVIEALQTGLKKFKGVHFQTTIHKLILEFVEPTPEGDYSRQAQDILKRLECGFPEYVIQVRALYPNIRSMHEFGKGLKKTESETLMTLANELEKDLDFFISQHPDQAPDPHALEAFKTKFNSRLHSQDLILCQQENWNSFALNLFLAVISVGLALVAQAIYSKWNTGQCTFFARETEKQQVRDEIACGLDGLVY